MEEINRDFLNWLEMDTSVKILSCLEDPTDLASVCCVSCLWRQFVILNGLFKQLCLKLFPQLADAQQIMQVSRRTRENAEAGTSNSSECEALEMDHKIYVSLARVLTSSTEEVFIENALFASSTDNDPLESLKIHWIHNPEYTAYFEEDFPIYSAQAVRFQMGYWTMQTDDESDDTGTSNASIRAAYDKLWCEQLAEKKFTWTYTSQEFPMAQENGLQRFVLPVPILCIGGILRIELLGRVQREKMDDLFYICVAHVRALGRSISSTFGFEIMKPSGKLLLKYFPEGRCEDPMSSPQVEYTSSGLPILPEGLVQEERWNEILDLVNEADAAYAELFHFGLVGVVDPESEDEFSEINEENIL